MNEETEIKKLINPISITVLILFLGLDAVLFSLGIIHWIIAVGWGIITLLIAESIKIADQWEKAALEVRRYVQAVTYIAQTGLRDIIGRHELADLLQNREKIAEALQHALDEHTSPWGITCQNVGIKDIVIPAALADAMSKQAQAERERQARIILGTAETEISEKFAEASKQYQDNPVALQLRGMNMLFEGLKEKGSLIIVPSSALESMNLGAIGGVAALSEMSNRGKEESK